MPGGYLKRETAFIGQDAFSRLVAAKIPEDQRRSLHSSIEQLENG
jgi:hypothetical protein